MIKKSGDFMKKADIILILTIGVLALVGWFVVRTIEQNSIPENGVAYVVYNNQPILEIELSDGSFTVLQQQYVYDTTTPFIYIVEGTNGPVTIEYNNGSVRVIDEISPRNICQDQGWSNTPFKPITCLPNNLVIIIKDESTPSQIDGTG